MEKIAEYALIGDLQTAALLSRKGSLRWLCWPDFDSEACFASLLGDEENGIWELACSPARENSRRYLPGTMVLETTHRSFLGATAVVHEFMPIRDGHSCVVRRVKGQKGCVRMHTRFAPRFDYGSAQSVIVPEGPECWSAISGPHRLTLRTNVLLFVKGGDLQAEWIVEQGESFWFTLQYSNSYTDAVPEAMNLDAVQQHTEQYWLKWSKGNTYSGKYKAEVERSLLTLKALTYKPSGGYVAAPTTSLPEKVGGIRNWDYRFCWLRDTTFSLLGLLHCGYEDEARAWLDWLGRSVQGNPEALKIMYGISGKREHSEWEADWLRGYSGSSPVHIGNKASSQLQLDTFGEILDALYQARLYGLYPCKDQSGKALEIPLLQHLEKVWQDLDAGLWEFRGNTRQFTESKVMAWVAFDRGIRMVEQFGMRGPVERWRKIRAEIHRHVCKHGFHSGMNSFTQAYGDKHMDASLLMLPLVGFLPIEDPRVAGTVKAVEKHLLRDGLILRYDTRRVHDGLPPGDGAFLACNFWLVDVYVLQGRMEEARALFEKLLALSNDVGLLSEEYDSNHGLIGNFPQAFSHIGLVNAALSIEMGTSARLRSLNCHSPVI